MRSPLLAMDLFFLEIFRMDDNVKFTAKKVDESWKEHVSQEKLQDTKHPVTNQPQRESQEIPSETFSQFLTSLAMQTLVHLGEIENPTTGEKKPDLNSAREIIDLLGMLKQKTSGNLTAKETKLLQTMLTDLQIKFVQASGT